ncbi:MAG: GxxExxY protein [Bacteroidales bacterium]|nr:GxxExxY protein [Candidatus Colicola faecequi]
MINLEPYIDKVYEIIGAALDVHRELNAGLLEPVYNEALCIELEEYGVYAEPEVELPVYYKGKLLNKKYRMDIVCGEVIIELKAVSEILPEHRAQLFNYLRLTKKPVGLLINFGEKHLHAERYYFDEPSNMVRLFHADGTF